MKIEELISLGAQEAYDLFAMDSSGSEKEYIEARYGKRIHFDYYDYLNGSIYQNPKTGKIRYMEKEYNLSDFYTEIEERKRIINKELEKRYCQDDIMSARE